jgi:hypothetical protein
MGLASIPKGAPAPTVVQFSNDRSRLNISGVDGSDFWLMVDSSVLRLVSEDSTS